MAHCTGKGFRTQSRSSVSAESQQQSPGRTAAERKPGSGSAGRTWLPPKAEGKLKLLHLLYRFSSVLTRGAPLLALLCSPQQQLKPTGSSASGGEAQPVVATRGTCAAARQETPPHPLPLGVGIGKNTQPKRGLVPRQALSTHATDTAAELLPGCLGGCTLYNCT